MHVPRCLYLNSPDKLAMVASTVSSKLIEVMAKKEGFNFEECLTGTSDNVVATRKTDVRLQDSSISEMWLAV